MGDPEIRAIVGKKQGDKRMGNPRQDNKRDLADPVLEFGTKA